MKASIVKINSEKSVLILRVSRPVGSLGFMAEKNYWVRVQDASKFVAGSELTLTDDEFEALNEIKAE